METSSLTASIQEVRSILRPYQAATVDNMVRDGRRLNYADMGMGKSLMSLLAIIELKAFPCLIVCPKPAMAVLEQELMKWFNLPSTIYVGKPKDRDKLWNTFIEEDHKFIITNYSLATEVAARFGIGSSTRGGKSTQPTGTHKRLHGLIADEIQNGGLFNHKTKTYKTFVKFAKSIPHVFLLTGTPYRRGVIDFYGPLSLINPNRFDSYWKYVGRWCRTIDTGFGKAIERNPKNVVEFRAMLREYADILKKEDHIKDMPPKIRQAIPVTTSGEQHRVYQELEKELFAETDTGELIMAPGVLSQSVRLRQLLVCPQELGLSERGAALDTMIEMAGDLVEDNKPFVIFTPFRKAVPWIRAALQEEFGGIKVFEITGGLTPQEFGDRWKGFQDGRGTRVLICVIKSGTSFHATAADTAFFLGCEYDFNQNTQAEDRLYRIGQTRTVNCYYFLHKETIEDEVIRILNDKKYGADLVLSEEALFRKMLAGRGSNNN